MEEMQKITNYTDIDYVDVKDPFDYQEYDYQEYMKISSALTTFEKITDIIELFVYTAIVTADVFLIIVILRNPKLKAIRSNKLIMHFCIFNTILILSYPLISIFFPLLGWNKYFNWDFYCLEVQLESTGILGLFLIGFGLSFHWFITINSQIVNPVFQKFNDNSILITYTLCLLKLIIDIPLCFLTHTGWSMLAVIILILFIIIFLLVSDCKIKTIDKQKNYPLTVANIIILSWMPLFILHFLSEFIRHEFMMRTFLDVIFFIPEFLAYGSPIIIIFWLGSVKKQFKSAFKKTLSRFKCSSNVDYIIDEETEDEEELNNGGNEAVTL